VNDNLIVSSPLAWIVLNKFINENQQPIEFTDHRFLIDIYADDSDDIVSKKSAQVGFSVAAILKSFHDAKFKDLNVIYALPTNNIVQDFVKPKVNPLIASNKALARIVADDSVSYKRVGQRNVFFKGGFSDREAISITGDVLVVDEYDRMPDMGVVNTFDSRLQASKNPKRRRFSNPSQIGFGVDLLYQDSDQRHWFVTCFHCNHRSFMEFERLDEYKPHYIDKEKKMYVCGKCGKEITDAMRRMGEWVTKFPSRKRHGYWFSQMMAPWVSAERILEQHDESNIEFFHNFVLGKAYTPSDLIVNRETILRACAPSLIPKTEVVIGVDQNVNEQIWVAGTPQGIFAHGRTKSWEDFEHIKLMYNALIVSDPMPYPVMPRQLAAKYKDFYMCRFKQFDGMQTVQWEETKKVVYVDRTRGLDTVANEITQAKLLFRENPYALEDYIADWQNLYRTTVEKPNGKIVSEWLKKDNKESDFSLATLYFRVGLSKMLGGSPQMGFAEPLTKEKQKADYITNDGRLLTDMNEKVQQALDGTAQSEDWRYS
jgi:DNA-directed RNA polymerase subunit RPC12/RpoP